MPLPYLKAWRIQRRLGQNEMAERAGLSPSTVGRAEKGDQAVSFVNIRKLAEALGITGDELEQPPPRDYLRGFQPPQPKGGAE